MRKLMAAGLLALPLGIGCSHVGGMCDCAPVPGDSTGYNPHITYHATCPTCGTGGAAVVVPTTPISTPTTAKPDAAKPDGDKPAGKNGDSFEPVGPPKAMPKDVKNKPKT